jgi:hypothetical protein
VQNFRWEGRRHLLTNTLEIEAFLICICIRDLGHELFTDSQFREVHKHVDSQKARVMSSMDPVDETMRLIRFRTSFCINGVICVMHEILNYLADDEDQTTTRESLLLELIESMD